MSDWNECDSDGIQLIDQPVDGGPVDGLTGELVNELTADELLDLYQHYTEAEKAARNSRIKIAAELAARSPKEGDCRTTRIRGDQRRAKIEYPEDAWQQSQLKEAWHSFPEFRDEFLSIAELRVKLKEYKKALRETGPDDFETFKGMLVAANRGAQGLPRIVIEE
jgi:hypothetical protein